MYLVVLQVRLLHCVFLLLAWWYKLKRVWIQAETRPSHSSIMYRSMLIGYLHSAIKERDRGTVNEILYPAANQGVPALPVTDPNSKRALKLVSKLNSISPEESQRKSETFTQQDYTPESKETLTHGRHVERWVQRRDPRIRDNDTFDYRVVEANILLFLQHRVFLFRLYAAYMH